MKKKNPPITPDQIVEGAKFKTAAGIVWIIDKVENLTAHTSMQDGNKGNYKDPVHSCAEFLTEENSVKL